MPEPVLSEASKKDSSTQVRDYSNEPERKLTPWGSEAQVLALQDRAGNRAVSQFLSGYTDKSNYQPGAAEGIPPIVKSVLQSSGQPLDPATRAYMESRFGQDFSGVRVHTDGKAAESAQAVNANAYTVNRDLVFDTGMYAPDSTIGKRRLAHELAHVVQQSNPGSSGATHALETEAHAIGDLASAGHQVSVGGATHPGALQREEAKGDGVRVIPKPDGNVAVVFVKKNGEMWSYGEFHPPRGVSAAAGADQIKSRIRISEAGPVPKVDVILPTDWGPQKPFNPKLARVMDTNALKREQQEAQRKTKVNELRDLYQQYLNDREFHFQKFGDFSPLESPATSDDEIMSLPKDNVFFEWMQRRQRKSDWQSFQNQARAMGYDDPEGIKEMWKHYRQPELKAEQQGQQQFRDLMYDPEHALQQDWAKPLLLQWMASDPKPEEVPSEAGKAKKYKLSNGITITLDDAQYARLAKAAKDRIETELNAIQGQKERYQFHKQDRGWVSSSLDALAGAKLEGKSWGGIDESRKAGLDALAKGDLKTSLAHLENAEKHGVVARTEWNRYERHREVAGEVWIEGLEYVKTAAEVTFAIGTGTLGGEGLLILAGKNVQETIFMGAVKQYGGQHVDWGDVSYEVGTHVISAAVMHGFGKLLAKGPNSMIMKAIRENYGAQVAVDVAQSVLIDSATHAAKQAYEQARGRGEKVTRQGVINNLTKYLTDPSGLPLDVVKAQLARHATRLKGRAGAHGEDTAVNETSPEHPSSPGLAPEKGTASGIERPGAGKDAHSPSGTGSPQHEIGSPSSTDLEATGSKMLEQKPSLTAEASESERKGNANVGTDVTSASRGAITHPTSPEGASPNRRQTDSSTSMHNVVPITDARGRQGPQLRPGQYPVGSLKEATARRNVKAMLDKATTLRNESTKEQVEARTKFEQELENSGYSEAERATLQNEFNNALMQPNQTQIQRTIVPAGAPANDVLVTEEQKVAVNQDSPASQVVGQPLQGIQGGLSTRANPTVASKDGVNKLPVSEETISPSVTPEVAVSISPVSGDTGGIPPKSTQKYLSDLQEKLKQNLSMKDQLVERGKKIKQEINALDERQSRGENVKNKLRKKWQEYYEQGRDISRASGEADDLRKEIKETKRKLEYDSEKYGVPKTGQEFGHVQEKVIADQKRFTKNTIEFDTSATFPKKVEPDYLPKEYDPVKREWIPLTKEYDPVKREWIAKVEEAAFVGDSKAYFSKKITLTSQIEGFIELASKTKHKLLVLYTNKDAIIDIKIVEMAKKEGVKVVQIKPYRAGLIPRP